MSIKLSREPQIPSCDSGAVLHKFVEMVTELNRSDITVWFPWLTDLVFFGAYAVIREHQIARLVGRSGKCPFPGVPLSVKVPKPGSPVRSVMNGRHPRKVR